MHPTLSRLARICGIIAELTRLPRARLYFYAALGPAAIGATYRDFTRAHPRYRIIGHKTMGAALIDTARFSDPGEYRASIDKRNCGGFFARRARSRGYRLARIDRNRYIDDIHAINTSLPQRQGRPMEPSYRERTAHFVDSGHYRYYGVLDQTGKLMAYCELGIYGNFALFSRLLGYRNNDGIMHFMLVEIVAMLIAERQVRYAMYGTWFGATEGLRHFKAILGFQPYRVKYELIEYGRLCQAA